MNKGLASRREYREQRLKVEVGFGITRIGHGEGLLGSSSTTLSIPASF